MNLLTCTDLAFSYDGHAVSHGINFSVEEGDYLCILGENGAGKSTLMKGLLGLKKPASGKIERGADLRVNEIGYLPQQTLVQRDFPASVYEVVQSGALNSLRFAPFYSARQKRMAVANMERLGITHLARRSYRELSGGQQQRVLLARALCATKRLLLLDEPAAGLDPVMTSELYELIERINREMNITVMMVSHDVNSAVKYARHILHLNHGQLFFGKTEDYIKSDVGRAFMSAGVSE